MPPALIHADYMDEQGVLTRTEPYCQSKILVPKMLHFSLYHFTVFLNVKLQIRLQIYRLGVKIILLFQKCCFTYFGVPAAKTYFLTV